MSKRTKITAIIIVVAAAAIIAAGATLAFFTDSDSKTNTFTTGEVKVELSEPSWNPENGKKYGPGDIILKNPQVKNIDKTDAWVAIRVRYKLNDNYLVYSGPDGFKAKLLANNGLDFQLGDDNSTNRWIQINTSQDPKIGDIYMYTSILPKDQTTIPLFNNVPIGFDNIELIGGKLPSFDINVQGFGVQAENLSQEDAKAQLIELVKKESH